MLSGRPIRSPFLPGELRDILHVPCTSQHAGHPRSSERVMREHPRPSDRGHPSAFDRDHLRVAIAMASVIFATAINARRSKASSRTLFKFPVAVVKQLDSLPKHSLLYLLLLYVDHTVNSAFLFRSETETRTMDHKTWLWRKKRSEKTIVVATDNVDISSKRLNEEIIPMEGGRDRLVKMAPVANAGGEMAEADAITVKKELDEAPRQGKLANEKLTHLEVALKDCTQQLNFIRDERLEELTTENSRLSKALLVKEELIENQQKLKSRSEAEFGAVMDRLGLTEKENAFLKYEFHVLEKELEIRNEEMGYNCRSSDLAHKQHSQDSKEIAKLEAECQKLRLLLRKRLPGPAAVAKMKNEVEMPGKDKSEMSTNLLLEQLCNVEEENKTLREIMIKKNAQIQSLSSITQCHYSSRNEINGRFVEMEKLALSDVKESVPFEQGHCGFSNTRQMQSKDVAGERSFDWLQVVLQAISEQKRISNRSLVRILEDIKIALGCSNLLNTPDVNKNACSIHPIEIDALHISGYIGWKSPHMSPTTDSLGGASSVDNSSGKTKSQQFQPNLSKSIVNFSVTPQEASSARDKIKRHFGWNDSHGEKEVASASHCLVEENKRLKEDLKDLKTRLESATNKSEAQMEVGLEYKNSSCDELEATCLELQLQLESVAKNETLKYAMNQEWKLSQKGWEITAASVKLAECQETILNLGKQFKVLVAPQDAVHFEKIFSNCGASAAAINNRRVNERLSLHDRMLAENGGKADVLKPPKIQEAESSSLPHSNNLKNLQAYSIPTLSLLSFLQKTQCGDMRERERELCIVLIWLCIFLCWRAFEKPDNYSLSW
ncbi:RING/U-box domain-containing protein isoform 1 [Hibiscus syriacus]|uniref:RING/U-box domain-containing protein isoform 1 n=1 Tax=Hibiscus syriacus TaxID=106335 RepID=A0A6A3BLG4_HIBSY|nr:RING/U-box domain-containing protein isoform 1 [Hibiscus syriacus]